MAITVPGIMSLGGDVGDIIAAEDSAKELDSKPRLTLRRISSQSCVPGHPACNLPSEMTARHLISLLAVSFLSAAEAKAGSAPQQLHGKSITLSWSESGVFKRGGTSFSNTYNLGRLNPEYNASITNR
jgi:hypothetical protein